MQSPKVDVCLGCLRNTMEPGITEPKRKRERRVGNAIKMRKEVGREHIWESFVGHS